MEPMETREKITILLAEYNTLRQEVIAARTNVGQGIHVFSVATMADIAFGFSHGRNVPEITIIIGICWFATLQLYFFGTKITRSLSQRG